jgi:hypothetical protein
MLRTTVIVFQPDPIIVRPEWQVKIWPPFSIKTEHHEFKTILIVIFTICATILAKNRTTTDVFLLIYHFLPPTPHLITFSPLPPI